MAGSLGDGEIYTVEDVAPFLGMTPNGVRSAVHRGELKSCGRGPRNKLLFHVTDLKRFFSDRAISYSARRHVAPGAPKGESHGLPGSEEYRPRPVQDSSNNHLSKDRKPYACSPAAPFAPVRRDARRFAVARSSGPYSSWSAAGIPSRRSTTSGQARLFYGASFDGVGHQVRIRLDRRFGRQQLVLPGLVLLKTSSGHPR